MRKIYTVVFALFLFGCTLEAQQGKYSLEFVQEGRINVAHYELGLWTGLDTTGIAQDSSRFNFVGYYPMSRITVISGDSLRMQDALSVMQNGYYIIAAIRAIGFTGISSEWAYSKSYRLPLIISKPDFVRIR